MKVAFDTAPLSSGHSIRGMGVYVRGLLRELEKLAKKRNDFEIDAFEFANNLSKLGNYDLIHYPYFDLFFLTLPSKFDTKAIVTVPDVIPLLYPNHYPPGVKGKMKLFVQTRRLQNADAVITLSETSKKDIVRFFSIDSKNVFPIHLAPQFKFQKQDSTTLQRMIKKYKLPKEYVLYVGDANYNKNLVRLAKACKKIATPLVLVGSQIVSKDYDKGHVENRELRRFHEQFANDKDIIRLGYIKNEEFQAIWQLAAVYCQPSLYEGFGLPVLEAMAAGVPVVASRTQVLVEIAEGAVVFFDPRSVSNIARALDRVLKDPTKRKKMIKKGKKYVKQFSWNKTALETIKVYKQIVNK